MIVNISKNVDRCRDCFYSSNSSQEHNCAFTSAPYPVAWYCNYRERFLIYNEYKIDKNCPIKMRCENGNN